MEHRPIYDFGDYDLKDLFKIRDALDMLDRYGLASDDLRREIKSELDKRADRELVEKHLLNPIRQMFGLKRKGGE
jgi:hypothetical protein